MDAKLIQIPPSTVDEFCDLIAKRKEFAPTEARYQKLYAELKEKLSEKPAAAEFTAKGERHTLNISACGNESTPDPAKVRRKLGATLFLKVVKITMTALSEFLPKSEIDDLVTVTQSGPRRYSALPIAPAAAGD